MYLVFGNKIIDSSEWKDKIEENTDFKVIKDMSKGTKREDIAAYNLSISISIINEDLKDMVNINTLNEDELFDEYMSYAEETYVDIEEILLDNSISMFAPYKWDKSDNDIKGLLVFTHEEIGTRKLKDILTRLLSQVE